MTEPPDISDEFSKDARSHIEALEKSLMSDAKEGIDTMGQEMISAKVAQQTLLAQSAADGGPASVQDAIWSMMDYLKIGIRDLSRRSGIRRKILLGMIEGRIPISAEDMKKIYDVFYQRSPGLFSSQA